MLSASLIQLEYDSKHWKSTFSYFQPQDTLLVYPLIQQDPLYRAGLALLQLDDGVVHPLEPREAEGLHR